MSAGILGFIFGFIFGGGFGMIMISLIITASEADEREERLYQEYLKKKEGKDAGKDIQDEGE